MGTEYYLVKPNKKEIFYLGRRISCINGAPIWHYKKQADYASWECLDDVLMDLYENSRYFFEEDMTFRQVWDLCYDLFDWCDDKVYLDNDCSENASIWLDWKETGSVFNYFKGEK